MTPYYKLLVVAFLGVVTKTWAEPSITEVSGLYNSFKDDSKHLSPVNGAAILMSGVLANVRFRGAYGPQNPSYLCHYTITHPFGSHRPTADRDCPQDHTTSIVQQLLPSPAGGTLALAGPKHDFFKLLSIKQIGEFLKLYTNLKRSNASMEESVEAFTNYFMALINPDTKKRTNSDSLNALARKELRKLWSKQGGDPKSILEDLAKKYGIMFAASLSETDKYPLNFVESTLLALAWKKADKIADLAPLLEELTEYRDLRRGESEGFNKDTYKTWKETAFQKKGQLNKEAFAQLLQSPEKLMFLTFAYNVFEDPYPKILITGTSSYKTTTKTIDYSDCGETSLRGFFNVMTAEPSTRTFNTDYLRQAFPQVSVNILQFYNGTPEDPNAFKQATYDDVTGDNRDRSAWANILSNQNSTQESTVSYAKGGVCSIRGGPDSIFALFEKLLNDKTLSTIFAQKNNSDKSYAKMMTYILDKLSREDMQFSWHIDNQKDLITNESTLIIQVNGVDKFTWKMESGHYEFAKINETGNEADWRRNNPDTVKWLIEDVANDRANLSLPLFSSLLPVYLGPKSTNLFDEQEFREIGQRFAPEIIYGRPLGTPDKLLEAFDLGVRINPQVIASLAPFWLNQETDEPNLNRALVSLVYKHPDFFSETHFTSENYPALKELYNEFNNKFINKNNHNKTFIEEMLAYLDNPFSDTLVIKALAHKSSQKSDNSLNTAYLKILERASMNGHLELVKELVLKTQGKVLNTYYNSLYDNPLFLAAIGNQPNIVKFLFEEPTTQPAVFSQPSSIIEIFERVAQIGKVDVVKVMIENPRARAIILNPDYYSSDPIHTIYANVARLLLQDPDLKAMYLQPKNIKARADAPQGLIPTNLKITPLQRAAAGNYNFNLLNFIDGIPEMLRDLVEVYLEDPEVARVFLDKDIIRLNEIEGNTPLHLATKQGYSPVVKVLLENKVAREILLDSRYIKNSEGRTPLHIAVLEDHYQSLKTLLTDDYARQKLLDPTNIHDKFGHTPLHTYLTASIVNFGILQSLLEKEGAEAKMIFTRDATGKIPLLFSRTHGEFRSILDTMNATRRATKPELLKDSQGRSVLHILVNRNPSLSNIMGMLQGSSMFLANYYWYDNYNKTPIDYINNKRKDYSQILKAFQERKQDFDRNPKYEKLRNTLAENTQAVDKGPRLPAPQPAGVRPAQPPQGVMRQAQPPRQMEPRPAQGPRQGAGYPQPIPRQNLNN